MKMTYNHRASEFRRRLGLGLVALPLLITGCASDPVAGNESIGEVQQALTTCVTITRGAGTVADARISKSSKNQNFGSNPILQVGKNDETLLRFDLSGIPASAVINSATLKLYSQGEHDDDNDCHDHGNGHGQGSGHGHDHHDDDDGRIRIHRAKDAWGEGSVTYKNFDQDFDSSVAGILMPHNQTALQSASVKTLVSQWVGGVKPNHGFLLEKKNDDDKTIFVSSESNNAALRPALEVCYTTPDANHCDPNPCAHGSCTNTQSSYTCACDAGWSGTNCDTNINDCAGNPCENGATCTDGVNGYTCACAPGFSGANCETNINDCAPNPCQNDGVCTDGINAHVCTCDAGFSGENCETNIDDCAGAPCMNNGTCTDQVNGYACACPAGYTGTNCEVDIDECSSNPCQNGDCVDQVNSYVCACYPGFEGATCENNIDECAAAPCLNGGVCDDGIFSYSCACAAGYTGTNCEVNVDDCASNPCQNAGVCGDGVNSYTCECAPGWTGTNCDEPTAPVCPCTASPMWNAAFAHLTANASGNVESVYVPGQLYVAQDSSLVTSSHFATVIILDFQDGTGSCDVEVLATADDPYAVEEWYSQPLDTDQIQACFAAAQQALPSNICPFVDLEGMCGNGTCVPGAEPGDFTCDCQSGWTGEACDQVVTCPCSDASRDSYTAEYWNGYSNIGSTIASVSCEGSGSEASAYCPNVQGYYANLAVGPGYCYVEDVIEYLEINNLTAAEQAACATQLLASPFCNQPPPPPPPPVVCPCAGMPKWTAVAEGSLPTNYCSAPNGPYELSTPIGEFFVDFATNTCGDWLDSGHLSASCTPDETQACLVLMESLANLSGQSCF